MRYVYTIFIFLTALIFSTGCGLVDRLDDLIPTPTPAAQNDPEESTSAGETISGIEEEIVAETTPVPTPTPVPEHVCNPATERCYGAAQWKCILSDQVAEDANIRVIAVFWITEWSNGDVFVSSVFSLRRNYSVRIGSFAGEHWYLASEDAAGRDYLIDFTIDGHADDAFRRGFRMWADLSGRGTLYFSEPGVYSAEGGQCDRL